MSCNCCAQVDLSQCQDGITMYGHLSIGQDYRVVVSNNRGIWEHTYAADGGGNIVILPADYPAGLFNPYAGPLRLELYRGQVKQDFKLLLTFDCVNITVLNGTFEDAQIGELILV